MTELIAIVILTVALFLSPILAGGFGVIGASIIQILIGLGGVAFALSSRRPKLVLPVAAWGLLALTGLAAVSVFGSESLYQSLRIFLLFSAYLLGFVLVVNLAGTEHRFMIAPAVAIAAAGFALSALGVREFTTGPGSGWRVFSTFVNPNYFSGFLVMAIPVMLALYLSAKERAAAIALGVAVVLAVAALNLTAARFGIAAGAIGLGAFFVLGIVSRSIDKSSIKRLLIVAALTAPLLLIAIRPVAERVASASEQAHSGQFRVYTWRATADMALANPITGTGAGTFEIAFPRYAIAGYTRSAHQTFLQTASEMGLLAPVALLFSLACIALAIGRGAIRARRDDNEHNSAQSKTIDGRIRALLLAGVFGGLLASTARNMVDSDWYVPALGLVFWMLAGWGYALTRREKTTVENSGAGRIVVGALALAVTILSVSLLLGGIYAKSGRQALQRHDLRSAVDAYKIATKFVPIAAEYHLELGRIQAAGMENLEPALESLRRAGKLEPTRARYPYVTGMVLASRGQHEEALTELQRATDLDPRSPMPQLALGDIYEELGRRQEALEVYRRMVRVEESIYERLRGVPELVEPAYAFARHRLATDAEQKEQFDDAIRHLEAAVERLERRRTFADFILAAQAGGIASVQDEMEFHNLLISSHRKLAELYSQIGEFDKSLTHKQRAEALQEEDPIGQEREKV